MDKGKSCNVRRFLSTLSLRRATILPHMSMAAVRYFYPRSPCGERLDGSKSSIAEVSVDFYPRSPCGERLCGSCEGVSLLRISIHALLAESDRIEFQLDFINQEFLSTLSLRRATIAVRTYLHSRAFLSTLSLRRATAKVHKTVGHFCAYETNFMGIASSC